MMSIYTMPNIKQLIFAPIFLVLLAITLFFSVPFLNDFTKLFSLSISQFIDLLIFAGLLTLSCITFIVFASLAQDWKVVLIISLVASALGFILIAPPIGFAVSIGIFVSLMFSFTLLEKTLKTYLNFVPTIMFVPPIKQLTKFLILVLALAFYLNIDSDIKKNGFQIPDSLIDTSLKLVPNPAASLDLEQRETVSQKIDPEEIELLKKNPQLLSQFGLDPKALENPQLLETIQNPSFNPSPNLMRDVIKQQFQSMVEPYINWIAPILTILFYFSLGFIISLLSLLIAPIVWLIFYSLEKSGFIKFITEMREVKKMIV